MKDTDGTIGGRPQKMQCDDVLHLMPLYVGGELEAQQLGSVASHLEDCAGCTTEWELGTQLVAQRQAHWRAAANSTPDLWARVSAQLEKAEGKTLAGEFTTAEPQSIELQAVEAPSVEPLFEGLRSASTSVEAAPAKSGARLTFPRRWMAAAALVVGAFGIGFSQYDFGSQPAISPGDPGSHAVGPIAVTEGVSSTNGEVHVSSTAPMATDVRETPASGLRRMRPGETSVLEEARPWGWEQTPAEALRNRTSPHKMAGGQ